MTETGITERIERFLAMVGAAPDAPWLRPPATDAEIEGTQVGLDCELPQDLVELLRVHNGGRIFDAHEWIPATRDPDDGLAAWRQISQTLITGQLLPAGQLDLVPGPRTLCVAVASQVEILYDLDDEPGRLLYLDTLSDPAVIPLARNLAALLDCFLALANDGYLALDGPSNPHLSGPMDEICGVFAAHKVAGALHVAIETWQSWLDGATFSID